MRILSVKPGHDGTVAYVEDGKLIFSLEAEKDTFPRYNDITAQLVVEALALAPALPDVLALGGWVKFDLLKSARIGAGYFGLDSIEANDGYLFGKPVKTFSSSHERSHIYMAAGMAPGAPIEECVILVWEGVLGTFYHWRDYGATISRMDVMTEPGVRYGALFALADPTFPDCGIPKWEFAGKLMALTGYADEEIIPESDRSTIESLLTARTMYPFEKIAFADSSLYNCGVNVARFHRAAKYLTDRLFRIFFDAASTSLPRDLPLLISGGCGLNCEWNRRWRESGLFTSVFVPPCANDSGSAIGTAIDALAYFGDPCQLTWNVYSGPPFKRDVVANPALWSCSSADWHEIARSIAAGSVVAWVQGCCEIGPRALGHRSLLASPLIPGHKDLLNRIKEREAYRPIAPCVLAEDLPLWFTHAIEDPYMLYFNEVRTTALPAVTHVDGTARVQSVQVQNEPSLHGLLESFRAITGYGVLCNTSLNFPGSGFINSLSDLFEYCDSKGIVEIVVDDEWYRRRS